MSIEKMILKQITVFDELDMCFSPGLNIFLGANGSGKTHLLKILYSACQAAKINVSFPDKLVRCFLPDDYQLSRLIRRKQGNTASSIQVFHQTGAELTVSFHNKTSKWNATVSGEDAWEAQAGKLSSIFIPAKEILSHSYQLNAAVAMNNVSFDDTYLDIINAAKISVAVGRNSLAQNNFLSKLEQIIQGTVSFDKSRDEFYLNATQHHARLEFNLVAEGIRKIALLWLLVKNGSLIHGSTLFWDEPESNINPAYIPILAEILLELQRNGVQIFLATHDYFLTKYLEVKRADKDKVLYHAFFSENPVTGMQLEQAKLLSDLQHNTIADTFLSLYADEVDKVLNT